MYAARQQEWVEKHGVTVGTMLLVYRSARDYEQGWGMAWLEGGMDEAVGRVCPVMDIHPSDGIRLRGAGRHCCYPFFVLVRLTQEELVLHALSDGLG